MSYFKTPNGTIVDEKGQTIAGAPVNGQYSLKDAAGKVLTGVDASGALQFSEVPAPNTGAAPVTRYTVPGSDRPGAIGAAAAAFVPGGTFDSTVKPYTPEEQAKIRATETQRVQAQVDAINSAYLSARSAQLVTNRNNSGRARATNAATGMIGSPSGDAVDSNVEQQNNEQLQLLEDKKNAAVQTVLTNVEDRVTKMLDARKLEAAGNTEKYLTYLSGVATQANNDIKTLAAAGTTFDDLRSKDPNGFASLLEQAGLNENSAKALFIANAPATTYINKDKPEIIGNKAIYFKQNRDGTISNVSVDLPGAPGKTIKDTISRDDGLYVLYTDGTHDVIGGPSAALVKARGDASGGGSGSYNGDFEATIKLAAQAGGSVFQQKQIADDMKGFISSGDYKSAYAQVLDSTAKKLGGTDGTKFNTQTISLGALEDMKAALKSLKDAGYDTNKLTGGVNSIQTKIGVLLTDPKYAAVATQVDTAFQAYRQNMTGAAFGAQESAEYGSVVPSSGNTFALNMAKIAGAEAFLNSQVENGIRRGVGQGGVEIKKYAEGAVPAAAPAAPAAPDQKELDSAKSAAVGQTVTIGGKQYKKTGADSYDPI